MLPGPICPLPLPTPNPRVTEPKKGPHQAERSFGKWEGRAGPAAGFTIICGLCAQLYVKKVLTGTEQFQRSSIEFTVPSSEWWN